MASMSGLMIIRPWQRNTAKVAIAGGAVYYTVQQGVWSNTTEGSAALENVRKTILPATATEYIAKIPSLRGIYTSTLGMWNTGVETIFSFVANTPQNIKYYSKKAVEGASSVTKSS